MRKCAEMAALVALAASAWAASGCGSSATPDRQADTAEPRVVASNDAGSKPSDSNEGQKTSSSKSAEPVRQSPRQSMDGIPLDVWPEVWFDDPLAVARVDGSVSPPAGAPSNATSGPPAVVPAVPANTEIAAAGGTGSVLAPGSEDWKAIVPMSVLEEETKRLRMSLSQGLQSVGKYNANRAAIKIDSATLAAVAGIVSAHPEPVRWKENAAHVRDLAADITSKAKEPGGDAYRAARAAFDPIVDILDGNTPAQLPASAPVVDFSEVASRGGLMKRMDAAFHWMKTNVTDERSIKAQAESVSHEAAMTAAIANVILAKGYASADEKEYQEYARHIIEGSRTIIAAAKEKRLDEFETGFTEIQRSCNDCHAEYRFGD